MVHFLLLLLGLFSASRADGVFPWASSEEKGKTPHRRRRRGQHCCGGTIVVVVWQASWSHIRGPSLLDWDVKETEATRGAGDKVERTASKYGVLCTDPGRFPSYNLAVDPSFSKCPLTYVEVGIPLATYRG